MHKKIAVLLASYNGVKYIKEQVDSILNQKEVDVTIFISDDLSTDGTLEYLNGLRLELCQKRLQYSQIPPDDTLWHLYNLLSTRTDYFS